MIHPTGSSKCTWNGRCWLDFETIVELNELYRVDLLSLLHINGVEPSIDLNYYKVGLEEEIYDVIYEWVHTPGLDILRGINDRLACDEKATTGDSC